ncbi:hypothetical protein [Peribacillus butanolivorans]|uniref:hypothetical protein n=1 Tax=Peribacillus butanolivorans TaxID=421767 RepID=UPI0013C312EA|nr:hypothetical protein [Peribacillus butanolivorans]QNU06140.1 hypothetical protein GM240_20995 [Peribacillus butanolivorans]
MSRVTRSKGEKIPINDVLISQGKINHLILENRGGIALIVNWFIMKTWKQKVNQ